MDGDHRSGHALIIGTISQGCLVRIHSRCLYGDALESHDCDCGPQLAASLDMMQVEGAGVLIYLEQEGRGAGLVAKGRGYHLSQQALLDSFESYVQLGYPEDARQYDGAAAMLKALALSEIRLLTNNPEKVRTLRDAGLSVRQVPLRILPGNDRVNDYLAAKRERRGHELPQSWWTYRAASRLSSAGGVVAFAASCGVIAELMTPSTVFGLDRVIPAVLGLLVGRWGFTRTRLLKAKIRLVCATLLSPSSRGEQLAAVDPVLEPADATEGIGLCSLPSAIIAGGTMS
ncbi:GTP cyclohydrolase II RibA [Nocardia sp. NPDC058058]|uniref:GTP cyclohydrolase II RibA n=1 Tax=Nocardia sp. NPDC058058 TaxID=3346317 RepID=UPI0036DB880E